MEEEYELIPFDQANGEALKKDLDAVLMAHDAEMQVVSSIRLFKRVPVKKDGEVVAEPVPSPYSMSDETPGEESQEEGEKKPDTKTT